MSKVEDLAKELFPLLETDKIGNNPYITYNTEQLAKQEGFVKGYHQAEKDLELTWEDLKLLQNISHEVFAEVAKGNVDYYQIYPTEQSFLEEVLKRFKERKNNSV